MRGVMFHRAGEPLTVETLPDPDPKRGELVIRVGRCGICGSDIHFTDAHGWFPEESLLGHEYAGEVVAIGKEVEGFRIGDVVTAMPAVGCGACAGCETGIPYLCERGAASYNGAFADFVPVRASATIKLPSVLTLEDGAIVEPLACGLHGAALADFPPGARVLVLGTGPVALTAIFWARRLGAGRIVAISRSSRRAEMAAAMGTDGLVVSGPDEQGEAIELLGGAPDVVFECIGAVGALGQAIRHVRPNGTVISLGFCVQPDAVLPAVATFKQVRLIFSLAYTFSELQFCVETLDRGHVEPRLMISNRIPIEEVPSMIEELRRGRQETKVMVDPRMR